MEEPVPPNLDVPERTLIDALIVQPGGEYLRSLLDIRKVVRRFILLPSQVLKVDNQTGMAKR